MLAIFVANEELEMQTMCEMLTALKSLENEDPIAWLALADELEEEGNLEQAELHRLGYELRWTECNDRVKKEERLQEIITKLDEPIIMPILHIEIGEYAGEKVFIDMVRLPGGEYMMGSKDDDPYAYADEKPQHKRTVEGFYMGETLVTKLQWLALMEGYECEAITNGDPQTPVESISWVDAQEFLKRLNAKTGLEFRLPKEVEWEYACRGGTTTAYNWGNEILPDRMCGDMYAVKPVKTYKSNAFGLYDMHGNLWEWCDDVYDAKAYEKFVAAEAAEKLKQQQQEEEEVEEKKS